MDNICVTANRLLAAFALYPLPGPDFDYSTVLKRRIGSISLGFAAHWDKNTNFAWALTPGFSTYFRASTSLAIQPEIMFQGWNETKVASASP